MRRLKSVRTAQDLFSRPNVKKRQGRVWEGLWWEQWEGTHGKEGWNTDSAVGAKAGDNCVPVPEGRCEAETLCGFGFLENKWVPELRGSDNFSSHW